MRCHATLHHPRNRIYKLAEHGCSWRALMVCCGLVLEAERWKTAEDLFWSLLLSLVGLAKFCFASTNAIPYSESKMIFSTMSVLLKTPQRWILIHISDVILQIYQCSHATSDLFHYYWRGAMQSMWLGTSPEVTVLCTNASFPLPNNPEAPRTHTRVQSKWTTQWKRRWPE